MLSEEIEEDEISKRLASCIRGRIRSNELTEHWISDRDDQSCPITKDWIESGARFKDMEFTGAWRIAIVGD